MKRTKVANFWCDITVHYLNAGIEEAHTFTRRDFSLEAVKQYCLTSVKRNYEVAKLQMTKIVITYDGKTIEVK